MRNQITKTAYDTAASSDMREVCELFADQSRFLDVITTSEGLVSRLVSFTPDAGLYNLTYAFAHDNDRYAIDAAIDRGEASVIHFSYETIADVVAHASELLASIDTAV